MHCATLLCVTNLSHNLLGYKGSNINCIQLYYYTDYVYSHTHAQKEVCLCLCPTHNTPVVQLILLPDTPSAGTHHVAPVSAAQGPLTLQSPASTPPPCAPHQPPGKTRGSLASPHTRHPAELLQGCWHSRSRS